jgi:hypothetical protein
MMQRSREKFCTTDDEAYFNEKRAVKQYSTLAVPLASPSTPDKS